MFRVPFLWMCLIAALAGTPLRQAEAADDFASALAELAGGHLVEDLDGGVGDDTGEVVLGQGTDGHSLAAALPPVTSTAAWLKAPLVVAGNGPEGGLETAPPLTPLSAFSRRHAWLQCFLF